MFEMFRNFSLLDDGVGIATDEDAMLNSTFCSIASSGYDGDEEDLGDVGDTDDDEMMSYEEECATEGDTNGDQGMDDVEVAEDREQMDVFDPVQIERSTPSFLSPSWLQSVVDPTQSARSQSLGSNEPRDGGVSSSRVQYHSVGTVDSPASSVHSRRPLVDVNNRHQSSGSGKAATRQSQGQVRFKPIDGNASANMGGNN